MKSKRKDIRLKNYDYSSNGFYFVTICTDFRKPFLEDPKIKEIVVDELAHLDWQAKQALPDKTWQAGLPIQVETQLWQRNYYEHVIRTDKALDKIREYIKNNPLAERVKVEELY